MAKHGNDEQKPDSQAVVAGQPGIRQIPRPSTAHGAERLVQPGRQFDGNRLNKPLDSGLRRNDEMAEWPRDYVSLSPSGKHDKKNH